MRVSPGTPGPSTRTAAAEEWPPAQYIHVMPADGRTVYDINGDPYPPLGVLVSTNDVYAHRRVRDGSLLLVPMLTATLAAAEVGADVPDIVGEVSKPKLSITGKEQAHGPEKDH